MSVSGDKNECGFLQVDNQILDLLLCDTQLNVYGILILCKIREYQRKKMQCFVSNATFAKLYKTSESMIKRQINELYNLGLIESVVTLNTDGVKGKTRLLRISRNYTKVLNKLLTTKQSLDIIIKGQNAPLHIDFDPRSDTNIKGQNRGITPQNDPRKNDIIKGQIIGSNHPISSGHSDPITINNNNNINNKLLEADTSGFQPSFSSSSPASSTDDLRNEIGDTNAIIPDANFSVSPNPISDNSINPISDSNKELQNSMAKRYPNQEYDEILKWFTTELNPISRYNYEIKWGTAAMNFAWGERDRKDNQKDAYTPEAIIEYFTKEDKLNYLKEIGYVEYLKEINYPNLWIFEM